MLTAIQDPDGDVSDVFCKLSMEKGAVVTSGDFQRVYTVDGIPYHHIIDLNTLPPADRWSSVTLVCDHSGIADGLSTALFVLPQEDGQKLLERYNAEALWIDADGNAFYSSGFAEYLID